MNVIEFDAIIGTTGILTNSHPHNICLYFLTA